MPTLQQWMDALTTPRSVKIESSHVLLASIQAKQVQQNALLQLDDARLGYQSLSYHRLPPF